MIMMTTPLETLENDQGKKILVHAGYVLFLSPSLTLSLSLAGAYDDNAW
jgi:hypothetical protein